MKKVIQIFITICIIVFAWTGICIGTDTNLVDGIEVLNKSEEFKTWESLSTEKRKDTIQPMYNNIPFKQSIKRSAYNTLLGSSENEVSKYSLISIKNDNINMIVKNQNKTNSCWAFAFSSVIESNIAKQNGSTNTTGISPMHIDYKTANMYNRKLGSGGSILMAMSYGANEYGPVNEEVMPFESVYSETNNLEQNYYLKDKSQVVLNQESIARIKELNLYTTNQDKEKVRKKIKQHIKEKGALMATIYVDFGITANDVYKSEHGFYNSITKAFYCNDSTKTINHGVTIVGWDDTFEKGNFATGKQPSSNGAWIVLNSYGKGFGDNGYFYVSYEDVNIQSALLGIGDITENNEKEYDYKYQYDELGMNQALNTPYLANVFTRKNTNNKKYSEYLNEIGIQLMSTQGIEIYVNPTGNDFSKLTKVASYTGENALEAGYHTIKLANQIKLTGTQFIIAIKYINEEGIVAPIECDLLESGFSSVSTAYDTATSNKNESYASMNGTNWIDLYGAKLNETVTLKNTNACIKAFTVKQEIQNIAVTGVTLSKDTYSIQEEATGNLVATVAPIDATIKDVTWTSSNPSVATVSLEGVIKGISEGKATITVTTIDGGYTDTCEVIVTKKVDDSDDIYIPDNEIKDEDNSLKDDNIQTEENHITQTPAKDKDLTTSNKILPNTGISKIIIILITTSAISILIYIKCKKYKDIK